jgi:hypothetical protein
VHTEFKTRSGAGLVPFQSTSTMATNLDKMVSMRVRMISSYTFRSERSRTSQSAIAPFSPERLGHCTGFAAWTLGPAVSPSRQFGRLQQGFAASLGRMAKTTELPIKLLVRAWLRMARHCLASQHAAANDAIQLRRPIAILALRWIPIALFSIA